MKRDDPRKLIASYRKRQQMLPFIVWSFAIILVLAGLILLVVWLLGNGKTKISLFATATPTETATFTSTMVPPTATPSITPTITETATPSLTPTRSGPLEYTVVEGDICYDLAAKFEIGLDVLLAINNFEPGTCPIKPGDKIIIPAPNQLLPTATPLPDNLPWGTKITYYVEFGDTLDIIAKKFNSTVEDIMIQNKELKNSNQIFAGQKLIIRVNLVTPVPTLPPTVTPTP